MKPGDLVRINPRSVTGRGSAPVWDKHPWRGPAVIQWRLPEGHLLFVLEHCRRVEEHADSGASRVISLNSGITGWVMDEYLDNLVEEQ